MKSITPDHIGPGDGKDQKRTFDSTIVAKFFERQRHWYQAGVRGAAIFERLAIDDDLPPYYKAEEAAAVCGLSAAALAMRRARRQPPSYVAHSRRSVVYPRHELIGWLGSMFIDRSNP